MFAMAHSMPSPGSCNGQVNHPKTGRPDQGGGGLEHRRLHGGEQHGLTEGWRHRHPEAGEIVGVRGPVPSPPAAGRLVGSRLS